MVLLAIDYGEKRIGIAKGDTESGIARPFCIIENKNYEFVLQNLKKIIKEENIDEIIIGIPFSLLNSETEQTIYTRKFIENIEIDLSIKVITIDERLTSQQAHGLFTDSRKRRIDDVAAMIMLQAYLDKKC